MAQACLSQYDLVSLTYLQQTRQHGCFHIHSKLRLLMAGLLPGHPPQFPTSHL